MQDLETLRNGGYRGLGLQKLKITEPLDQFPLEILDLAETLEHLDLAGTGLSALPDDFSQLRKLKIAFFSDCHFVAFPKQLSACPELEMVAFRSNGMATIPEDSLPPKLRWLILTNNRLVALPQSIGRCARLQKCMLAGNGLTTLPDSMAACKKLGLLRLSANKFTDLPHWLFELPELAFLSVAGTPCCSVRLEEEELALPQVDWGDIVVGELLGRGASGDTFKAKWTLADSDSVVKEVAVKLFKGDVTSDGTPLDEMKACLAIGSHNSLVSTLASIHGHPTKHGLIMQLIPRHYQNLGLPPSLQSCTRDQYESDRKKLSAKVVLEILSSVAAAALHLHSRKVSHCDLYAHNILFNNDDGHALLGDFGAATIYEHCDRFNFEKMEVLAFAHLIDDMLGLVRVEESDEGQQQSLQGLRALHTRCSSSVVSERPPFADVVHSLQILV